jgi:hypothetical protein
MDYHRALPRGVRADRCERRRSCAEMLSLLTKSFRVKAATVVAATYAFCVLLPAVAFALADGRVAPPCLMDDLAAMSMHEHAMSAEAPAAHAHHHSGASDAHVAAMAHHHGAGEQADALPPSDPDHGRPPIA